MSKKVTIISVLFDCEQFLRGFFENICSQTVFSECELVFLRPDSSPGNEKVISGEYFVRYPTQLRGIWTEYDPGLYELWNLGIVAAKGEYITNANPDDRRSPEHIARAIAFLDNNPEFDVCVTALSYTHDSSTCWETSPREADWFTNLSGEFTANDLFELDGKTGAIRSRNLPHCMPVWRRNLHERFGYFDEEKYGPSADWEFWLRVLAGGARAYLIGEVLGLYYVNPKSYWRTNLNAHKYDKKITSQYENYSKHLLADIAESPPAAPLINMTSALSSDFGRHRHGWSEAVRALSSLNATSGVVLEPFIEKKFHFGVDPGDFGSNSPAAHLKPWIGFLHCTEDTPTWFSKWLKPSNIFSTSMWRESLPNCQGLFVLSTQAAEWLRAWLVAETNHHIPVRVLLHPTNHEVGQFQWERFSRQPRIIQVGHWVRKLNSIYFLRTAWKRTLLQKFDDKLAQAEVNRFELDANLMQAGGVEIIDIVNDSSYDDLLASSIVFCNLYTAAANNAVLECISRNTPILVNRLPATSEYLGAEYPLLFSDLTEASTLISDIGRVKAAHEFLAAKDKSQFTYDGFLVEFKNAITEMSTERGLR